MKAAPFLSQFVKELRPAAGQAAIGTALTAGYGLLSGSPQAALAYGAGDFLLNVPAIALARRAFPGTKVRQMQVDKNNKPIIDPKTKKKIITEPTSSNFAQNAANIGASVATYPVVDAVTKSMGIDLYGQTRKAPQPSQYTFPTLGLDLPPEVLALLREQG
tara:strand:- start:988 stop:1470 length:483 start_codon:yes stop_codon:yes gene_type:complete